MDRSLETALVTRAREFADFVHFDQRRENKARQPFIVHPTEVVDLVLNSGGSEKEVVAAWLHDSIEDTPTTLGLIKFLFDQEVADIVDGLTDPPEFKGLPLLERKSRQAERVKPKSNSIKRVKLADQISNVRSVATDPPIDWNVEKCRQYIDGAKLIAEQCVGISPFVEGGFGRA